MIRFNILWIILLSCILIQCTTAMQEADVQVKSGEAIVSGNFLSTYQVYKERSNLVWYCSYKYVSTEHYGNIEIKEGNVQMDGANIVGAQFTFDTRQLKVKDITDTKENNNFEWIMKSPTFFNADSFETITITIDSIVVEKEDKEHSNKENTCKANAHITIKGITQTLNIPINYSLENDQINLHSTFKINRVKWDMTYGVETSTSNLLNDKIIDELMSFKLNITAVK
ncbi:MAG: YceI family protein [Bacteroidota bacterium]